jgi:hypothetical protein
VPASGSLAATAPTVVPFAEFSAMLKLCGLMLGASLTFDTFTVTVAEALALGTPLSVTCTVRLNVGVTSKLRADGFATVICPELELIANAPFVFPAVME